MCVFIYYIFEFEFGLSALMTFEFVSTATWRIKTEAKIKPKPE